MGGVDARQPGERLALVRGILEVERGGELRELQRAQDHIMLLIKTAQERVAGFLVEMSARNAGSAEVKLPMSRQDIADYLALSVETVSRALTQLKRRGMIRLTGTRQIIFLDRKKLIGAGEDHFAITDEPRVREQYQARRLVYSDS